MAAEDFVAEEEKEEEDKEEGACEEEDDDDGVLKALEFLDRGVEEWGSGRRSTQPAGAVTGDRNASETTGALAPWPSSVETRETKGSSASSWTEKPDERLCI